MNHEQSEPAESIPLSFNQWERLAVASGGEKSVAACIDFWESELIGLSETAASGLEDCSCAKEKVSRALAGEITYCCLRTPQMRERILQSIGRGVGGVLRTFVEDYERDSQLEADRLTALPRDCHRLAAIWHRAGSLYWENQGLICQARPELYGVYVSHHQRKRQQHENRMKYHYTLWSDNGSLTRKPALNNMVTVERQLGIAVNLFEAAIRERVSPSGWRPPGVYRQRHDTWVFDVLKGKEYPPL